MASKTNSPIQIDVQVRGIQELQMKFAKAPHVITQTMKDAATLVGDTVLNTRGLRQYPPETSANLPPAPYYERGKGMWVFARGFKRVNAATTKFNKNSMKASKANSNTYLERNIVNLGNSEQLGKQFYSLGEVTSLGSAVVHIGNRASYAPYVVGDADQSRAMARIGWRKLGEVAREKTGKIAKVFEAVVFAALKKAGL